MRSAALDRFFTSPTLRYRFVAVSLLLATLLLGALGLARVIPSLFGTQDQLDFGAYYVAARVLNQQGQLYDPEAMRRAGANIHFTGYIYPPFFAALMRPIALLPYVTAEVVWLIANTCFWISSVLLLCRASAIPTKLILPLLGLSLLLPAVYDTMLLGQVSLLLTLLLVGALVLSMRQPRSRRAEIAAGILLGIAAAIKVYPIVLGLVFVLHKRYVPLVAAVVTGMATVLYGALFGGGWGTTITYITSVLPGVSQMSPFPSNQSLRGVIARFFSYNQFVVPVLSKDNGVNVKLTPLIDAPALGTLLAYGFSAAVVLVSALVMVRQLKRNAEGARLFQHYGLMSAAMLLITPVVWDFYFAHLLVPLFALAVPRSRAVPYPLIGVIACFFLLLQRYWRYLLLYVQTPLLMMFGFIGLVLLWVALLREPKLTAVDK